MTLNKLYDNFGLVPQEDWPWPNFTPEEMACKCCGKLLVVPSFLDKLQTMRVRVAAPLVVTSGYRCPAYNNDISSTGFGGPHTTGCAADLLVAGHLAYRVLQDAIDVGMTGIGVNQKGDHSKRFIHVDELEKPAGKRPWVWSY